jgi:hypothetical protein
LRPPASGGQPNPNQPRSAIAGQRRLVEPAVGAGLRGQERAELGPKALPGRAEVERGQRCARLDQDIGHAAGRRRERGQPGDIRLHPAEQPGRVMFLEVADRGQRVVRAELNPARGQGDELHRDLRLQRPVGPAARVRGGRAVKQLAARADVDLAGGHPLLHGAEAADRLAELVAGLGVLDGQLVRALGRGQRPGGEAEPEQRHVLGCARRGDLGLRLGWAEGDRAPGGDGQARQRAAGGDRAEPGHDDRSG